MIKRRGNATAPDGATSVSSTVSSKYDKSPKEKGPCTLLNKVLTCVLLLLMYLYYDQRSVKNAKTNNSSSEGNNIRATKQIKRVKSISGVNVLVSDLDPAVAGKTNVAIGKTATQSSLSKWGGEAKLGVDGNRVQTWEGASITSTKENECSPWWQVDLQGVYDIEKVLLFNRMDCCWERLKEFHVEVWDDKNKKVEDLYHKEMAKAVTVGEFPSDTKGRTIKVRFDHCEPITLAEVEVYGTPV